MFYKQDDVKEFDARVLTIRAMLESSTADEIRCEVVSLMEAITWHDWTTDWSYPPGFVDNLKETDGRFVRQFADACGLFIDNADSQGLTELRQQADEYLQRRRLQAKRPKELSPQCTIPQWLTAFKNARQFFGEQRKFEQHMKALGEQGIAHKQSPRSSWQIELWYLEEKGIQFPSMS